MKQILIPGLVAAVVMLVAAMAIGWACSLAFPSLTSEYSNTALFRPWSDPLMWVFFVQPFWMGIGLAWLWNRVKGSFTEVTAVQKGIAFTSAVWAVTSIPGILMSYSSFPISLLMVLTWLISSLIQLLLAGVVLGLKNKP
jgi:hypothetical protein